jgi:hypothetical protein
MRLAAPRQFEGRMPNNHEQNIGAKSFTQNYRHSLIRFRERENFIDLSVDLNPTVP